MLVNLILAATSIPQLSPESFTLRIKGWFHHWISVTSNMMACWECGCMCVCKKICCLPQPCSNNCIETEVLISSNQGVTCVCYPMYVCKGLANKSDDGRGYGSLSGAALVYVQLKLLPRLRAKVCVWVPPHLMCVFDVKALYMKYIY